MIRKKFSKSLFNENDGAARDALISFYNAQGWKITENKDLYGPDLIASKDDKTYYLEVEIKYAWDGNTFPFSTVQLPERKSKFRNLDYPVAFYILKPDLTQALAFHETELTPSRLVEVKNKYISSGEYFYQIPIENTKLIKLET